MIFKRCLPRRLLGCAIALTVGAGMPALAAPPAEKAENPTAAKPAADKKKAAKAKPATIKTAKSKPGADKPVAKAVAKTTKDVPLPRARPVDVESTVLIAPGSETLSHTHNLSSPRFSPIQSTTALTYNVPY